jgi:hypothetical protein
VGFYRQGCGQKRLAFALTIGGGVCRATLFNSVSGEEGILNENALLGVWVHEGSAKEAPLDEVRHLIYIF